MHWDSSGVCLQASLALQEARLAVANNELAKSQEQLDAKQQELDAVQVASSHRSPCLSSERRCRWQQGLKALAERSLSIAEMSRSFTGQIM